MSKAFETALAAVAVPWRQKGKTALVEAYSPKLMGWTIIAQCEDTPELLGENIAALIVEAVNGSAKTEDLITELVAALETCLACKDGKLDFSAELDADAALRMAGKRPNAPAKGETKKTETP